jgi:hypothetical protein
MKRFILPIFIILLSSAIYVVIIDGYWSDIARAMKERAELDATIAEAERANTEIEKHTRTYESIPSDRLTRLDTLLPPTIDHTLLIAEINTVAERSGLVMKEVSVSAAEDAGAGYMTHVVRFSVSAPYLVFNAFLHDLERSLALRDVRGASFSSSLEGGLRAVSQTMITEYQVELVSYSLQ